MQDVLHRRLAWMIEPQILFPLLTVLLLLSIWGTTLAVLRVERVAAEQRAADASRELVDTYEAQVVRAPREIDQTLQLVRFRPQRRAGFPNGPHSGETHKRGAARRHDRRLAVAFLDLDRSKQINDSLGHEAGEQAEFLRAHACDELQGFYFQRPLPAAEFAQLLREQSTAADYLGECRAVPLA
jgi:hypothetical protein